MIRRNTSYGRWKHLSCDKERSEKYKHYYAIKSKHKVILISRQSLT